MMRDPEKAAAARDEAIDRVEKNAPEDWKHRVRVAIEALCKEREEITTDDVWERLELLRIDLGRAEPRAIGALMKQAQKAGWIEPTATFKNSERVECHRRPLRVWISKIYRPAPPPPAKRQGRLDY